MLLWSIFYFFWGEKITVNQGLGYDGVFYGRITQNFDVFIENKSFSSYYVNRILPCGIVYITLKTLGFSLSPPNIIHAFYILNTLSWIVSLVFCHKIMKHYQISGNIQWLMTVLLLINFYVLKFIFYTPVLTDSMAFLVGTLLLWFYTKNNLYAIIPTGLLGGFVYPLFYVYTCILVVLPVNFKFKSEEKHIKNSIDYFITGFLVFLFAVVRMYIAYRIQHTLNIGFHLNTLLYAGTYSYVLYRILPSYAFIKENTKLFFEYFKQKTTLKRILIAVVLLFVSTSVKLYLTQNPVMQNPKSIYLVKSLLGIDFNGALWLAEHFSGFGLIFVFIILFLKKIHGTSIIQSAGFHAIVLIFCVLMLQKELRVLTDIYAFMLLAVALTLQNQNNVFTQRRYLFLFGIINLLLSKFFLSIENSSVFWSTTEKTWIHTNYGLSTYLMNDNQYVVLLIVFLAVTGILYRVLIKKSSGE